MRTITTACYVKVAREGDKVFPLTPCCGAKATRVADNTHCLACRDVVASFYSEEGFNAVETAIRTAGCLISWSCAEQTLYELDGFNEEEE